MSFILDALKKSQAERSGAGVALRLEQRPARHPAIRWLGLALAVLVVFNLGLLAWIWGTGSAETAAEPTQAPAPVMKRPTLEQPAVEQPTIAPQTEKSAAEPAPRRPARTPPPAPIARVALADLPAAEQILYNGFTYSTHIFTDDPSLCAVVIDGQRLMAGDAFKGLTVVAITETGVIFEETRAGRVRHVEVSMLEQWES